METMMKMIVEKMSNIEVLLSHKGSIVLGCSFFLCMRKTKRKGNCRSASLLAGYYSGYFRPYIQRLTFWIWLLMHVKHGSVNYSCSLLFQ